MRLGISGNSPRTSPDSVKSESWRFITPGTLRASIEILSAATFFKKWRKEMEVRNKEREIKKGK